MKELKSLTFTTEFRFQFSAREKQASLPTKGTFLTTSLHSGTRERTLTKPNAASQCLKGKLCSPFWVVSGLAQVCASMSKNGKTKPQPIKSMLVELLLA